MGFGGKPAAGNGRNGCSPPLGGQDFLLPCFQCNRKPTDKKGLLFQDWPAQPPPAEPRGCHGDDAAGPLSGERKRYHSARRFGWRRFHTKGTLSPINEKPRGCRGDIAADPSPGNRKRSLRSLGSKRTCWADKIGSSLGRSPKNRNLTRDSALGPGERCSCLGSAPGSVTGGTLPPSAPPQRCSLQLISSTSSWKRQARSSCCWVNSQPTFPVLWAMIIWSALCLSAGSVRMVTFPFPMTLW